MKKLWFLLGVIVLLAVPATAFAKSPTPFTGVGNICLTRLPEITAVAPRRTGVRIVASGEELAATVTRSSGWDSLKGADIGITIDKETSTFDFTTLTFSGSLTGYITVTTSEEVLEGELVGAVSGKFLDPAHIIDSIYASSAQIQWKAGSKGEQAQGNATATFKASEDGSFCGPIRLTGTLKGSERR